MEPGPSVGSAKGSKERRKRGAWWPQIIVRLFSACDLPVVQTSSSCKKFVCPSSLAPIYYFLIITLVCGLLFVPQFKSMTQIMNALTTEETAEVSSFNSSNSLFRLLWDGEDDNDEATKEEIPLAKTPLNVIVLYPDDWRHDDLGDANPELHTPTFSALAADGIRFTYNAVTTSICWMSRATLFTGQYVSQHRSTYLFRPIFAQEDRPWSKTWPYLLQQAGYWVGHIGKWQYRNTNGYQNKRFNFSSFFEGWTVRKFGDTFEFNADKAGTEAIRFLRNRPPNTPFAATVAFYPPKGIAEPEDTHRNFTVLYENITYVEAYNRTEAYFRLPSFLQYNKTEARGRYLYRYETNGDFQRATVAQYATISHLDKVCGDIVAELKRQGIYNQTMVIVTADNGEFRGRHALADKWYPYQEAIRVPLIIHDPRMPMSQRGTLNDEFTLNIDLAATILGAAGLEAPPAVQGRDIADLYLPENPTSPLFRKEPWRKEFYYEFPPIQDLIPPSVALVRKDYKYIEWWKHGQEELFDVRQDPFELSDMANNSALATLKQEMRDRLHTLRHDYFGPDYVPGTRCDPTLKAGTDQSKLPNCSQYFPDRCCPMQS
jgi:arylsulfatase